MKNKFKTLILTFAVAIFASPLVAFAQDGADAKNPADSENTPEMMKGKQGDNDMGMMPMMGMMTQMSEMMETMTPEGMEKHPDKG